MVHTYTFVVNFRGGTYCSQVKAETVNDAVFEWIKYLEKDYKGIKHLGEKTIREIFKEAREIDSPPTPLSGLKNIWYQHFLSKQGSFSINIIQTDLD